MASNIRIFDRAGRELTEISADCMRSWSLNDYGKCEFTLSKNNVKAREEYLQFGNLILVEHNKLPAWSGVIDPPRVWGNSKLKVYAYSAAAIMQYNWYGKEIPVSGSSGEIYRKYVLKINEWEDKRLREGNIWTDGPTVTSTMKISRMLDQIRDFAKRTDNDFDVTHSWDSSGHLIFLCHWYRRFANDVDYILSSKRVELDEEILTEQGEIINVYYCYGSEPYEGDNMPGRSSTSDTSIAKYGRRDISMPLDSTKDISMMEEASKAGLARQKAPRKTFQLAALDVGETFRKLNIGNIVTVELPNVGFSGTGFGVSAKVRIVGMEYTDSENKCKLVCDEEV